MSKEIEIKKKKCSASSSNSGRESETVNTLKKREKSKEPNRVPQGEGRKKEGI